MSELIAGLCVLVIATLAVIGAGTLLEGDRGKKVMREAFERGFAVQCVGREGYYWSCEEPRS